MMWGGWDSGWASLGMMLLWLVFLAVIVAGAVFVVRSFSTGPRPDDRATRSQALDILDQRFARGEIDQAEYEARRRALTEGR